MTIYLYFIAVENEILQEVPQVIPKSKQEMYEYERANLRRERVKEFIEEEEINFQKAGFRYI